MIAWQDNTEKQIPSEHEIALAKMAIKDWKWTRGHFIHEFTTAKDSKATLQRFSDAWTTASKLLREGK